MRSQAIQSAVAKAIVNIAETNLNKLKLDGVGPVDNRPSTN